MGVADNKKKELAVLSEHIVLCLPPLYATERGMRGSLEAGRRNAAAVWAVQVETHQVDPGLKARSVVNRLKAHPFQKFWFQMCST